MSLAPRIDGGTILGAISAFGLVIIAMYSGGNFRSFVDFNSFLIVVGGTVGATFITFPLSEFGRSIEALRTAFFPDDYSVEHRTSKLLEIARRYRGISSKENLNSELLSPEILANEDSFFKQCVELLGEGLDKDAIRKILDIDLTFLEDRHRRAAQLFQTMGAIAPAMGLIGTLIGLVQMLQNLNDPKSIGPSMAVALITTFYGAVLANMLFIPLAGKLRARSEEEFLLKELTVEGIVGIAEGLNPRVIERRLLSFLPHDQHSSEYE